MAYETGDTWRVMIDNGATPAVFIAIGGEVSFDWNRSKTAIDTSTKDEGAYGTGTYRRASVTIAINGKVKLPDPGLEALIAIDTDEVPELQVKIMKGATVKWHCLMAVGGVNTSMPDNAPVTWSTSLMNVTAPTVDDLGA